MLERDRMKSRKLLKGFRLNNPTIANRFRIGEGYQSILFDISGKHSIILLRTDKTGQFVPAKTEKGFPVIFKKGYEMIYQEFEEKFDAMLPELMQKIREKAKKLFYSGGVDTDSYEDNFLLPKIILTAVLKHQAFQYEPHTKEDKKVVKNLEHF